MKPGLPSCRHDESGQVTPARMILRYREQPFQNLNAMIQAFFDWQGLQPLEDYCTHICSDPPSSKLYLVLDLHCKTYPIVDLTNLKLNVFKVSTNASCVASLNYYDLTKSALSSSFQDLGEVASKQALPRSLTLGWGISINQSNQMN
jgi:hypothetical protein